jgi:hypothetical protein
MIYDGREVIFIDYEYDQMASFTLPDGLIGIRLSGGLDSTTLFYAICKYITDLNLNIEILPMHGACKELWNSLGITQSIIDDVILKYPNIKIRDLELFHFDNPESKIKQAAGNIFNKKMYEKYPELNLIINAFTSLPSYKVVNKWKCGVDHKRVKKEFNIHLINEDGTYVFRPFVKCNKKLIANIFYHLKLPKKYLTETWSCTFYSHQTQNFTKPCGSCYHCWEKKWAFGQF